MTLPTHVIRTDGGTQPRAGIDPEHVARLREALLGGATLPPLTLYHDGADFWLADGYHRMEAHKATYPGKYISVDVRQGTRRDAVLYSTGANRDHGLPRSRDDLRRAIETLLRDEEWGGWSDREIARRVGCSPSTVGAVRPTVQLGQLAKRQGADGKARALPASKTPPTDHPPTHPDAVPAAPSDPLSALCGELHALEARQAAGMYGDDDRAALRALEARLEGMVAALDDGDYEGLARQIGRLRSWKPAQPAHSDGAPMSRAEEARRARSQEPPAPVGARVTHIARRWEVNRSEPGDLAELADLATTLTAGRDQMYPEAYDLWARRIAELQRQLAPALDVAAEERPAAPDDGEDLDALLVAAIGAILRSLPEPAVRVLAARLCFDDTADVAFDAPIERIYAGFAEVAGQGTISIAPASYRRAAQRAVAALRQAERKVAA